MLLEEEDVTNEVTGFSLHPSQLGVQITEQKMPFYQLFWYCLTRAELCVTRSVFLHSVHSDTVHPAKFLVFFSTSAMDIPIVHMGTFIPLFFPHFLFW